MLSEVVEGSPGNHFATKHGYREVLRDSQSVTTIGTIDPALLADVAARDHGDYRLVRWTEHVPEALVDSYALAKRAMADAPTGESGWETPPWDSTQIRDAEDRVAERGQLLTGTAAIAPDGTVAGLTEIVTDPRSPRRAEQEDTIVVPAHRGHALGLWMKADMIDRLRAEHPETVEISTWNAASNDYMLAINRALGFALQTTWLDVRTELEPAGR